MQGSDSDSNNDCLRFILLPTYRIFILACTLKIPDLSGIAAVVILDWSKSNHSDQTFPSFSLLISGIYFQNLCIKRIQLGLVLVVLLLLSLMCHRLRLLYYGRK